MSMQTRAFRPLSATQNATVTAGSAAIALNNLNGTRAVRVANVGAGTIFINFGEAATTAATTTTSMVMLANTVEVFTAGPAVSHVAVINGTATNNVVYTTVGEGL